MRTFDVMHFLIMKARTCSQVKAKCYSQLIQVTAGIKPRCSRWKSSTLTTAPYYIASSNISAIDNGYT